MLTCWCAWIGWFKAKVYWNFGMHRMEWRKWVKKFDTLGISGGGEHNSMAGLVHRNPLRDLWVSAVQILPSLQTRVWRRANDVVSVQPGGLSAYSKGAVQYHPITEEYRKVTWRGCQPRKLWMQHGRITGP